MTPTTSLHIDPIKNNSFRGSYLYDELNLVIKIKVSSRRSKTILEAYFDAYGISGFEYKISLLGWLECWSPRYQILD